KAFPHIQAAWSIAQSLGLPTAPELVQGIARIISDKIGGSDQASMAAYHRAREQELQTEELSARQHPWAYYPTIVAATVASPAPGMGGAAAATRVGNALRMAGAGGIMGTTQGVGEGVSRNESAADIAARGAAGGFGGAVIGGALGTVLPRAAPAVLSPG